MGHPLLPPTIIWVRRKTTMTASDSDDNITSGTAATDEGGVQNLSGGDSQTVTTSSLSCSASGPSAAASHQLTKFLKNSHQAASEDMLVSMAQDFARKELFSRCKFYQSRGDGKGKMDTLVKSFLMKKFHWNDLSDALWKRIRKKTSNTLRIRRSSCVEAAKKKVLGKHPSH